jgi:hypothetical protein
MLITLDTSLLKSELEVSRVVERAVQTISKERERNKINPLIYRKNQYCIYYLPDVLKELSERATSADLRDKAMGALQRLQFAQPA